jgi:hypothetical protein
MSSSRSFIAPFPRLFELFFHKREFAQVMDITQSRGERIALITLQSIVDACSVKAWRDANGIQAGAPSARMGRVVGQPRRGTHIDPPALFLHSHARLVLMQDRNFRQRLFEVIFNRSQVLMTQFDKASDAARRELDAEQIVKQLAGTSIGYGLAFHERDRQRRNAGPILGRSFDRCWKAGSCQMKACWTLFFFDPVLRHPETFGRQIDHLPSFWQICWPIAEVSLTVSALFDWMQDDSVRSFHLLEMMPAMTPLPAWLFAALRLQAFGGTHKAIRRRRQIAVVAILGLLPFQHFHPFLQHVDLPFQRLRVFLEPLYCLHGFFQGEALHLLFLLELEDLLLFLVGDVPPDPLLRSEVLQFFFLRHAATLTDLPLLPQLHSPTE